MHHYGIVRALRGHRVLLAATCGLVVTLLALHRCTNLGDFAGYLFSTGPHRLSLSLQCNMGRLGNQMCSYASLYGLSALNNRRPFVALSCNARHLSPHFAGLTAPRLHSWLYVRWNPWSIASYLRPEDTALPRSSNFIQGFKYPCSYTFFDHVQDEIRREFTFRDELMEHARKVLHQANNESLKSVTYVGVHVRRGDYLDRWLNVFEGLPVNMEYFEKALAYFRKRYRKVVFVGVSDDRRWCAEHLESLGVRVAGEAPSPAHDLAVLASCNHTVMTYGTFGFWGAYLAGGEVVYFDKFLRPGTEFTKEKFIFEKMYPPNWKGLVTVDVSRWGNGTRHSAIPRKMRT